jgi:hypothetical protein
LLRRAIATQLGDRPPDPQDPHLQPGVAPLTEASGLLAALDTGWPDASPAASVSVHPRNAQERRLCDLLGTVSLLETFFLTSFRLFSHAANRDLLALLQDHDRLVRVADRLGRVSLLPPEYATVGWANVNEARTELGWKALDPPDWSNYWTVSGGEGEAP